MPRPEAARAQGTLDGIGGGELPVRHCDEPLWAGRASARSAGGCAAILGSRRHRRLSAAATGDRCARAERRARSQVLRSPAPRSEEHTSELQPLMRISYAVFRLKTKNTNEQ